MQPDQLKVARDQAGWTQQDAAARLGVSQPYYSQLESGSRPIPARLVPVVLRELKLSPAALPLPPLATKLEPIRPSDLATTLGSLGYPGFSHLPAAKVQMNPAELVARSIVHADLDPRLTEGLPWLLATTTLDWAWLIAQCRILNLQNRLGFLASLAKDLGKSGTQQSLAVALTNLESSRLVAETTLCRDAMPEPERKWVRRFRPASAEHWNLLTTLTSEHLTHAA